MTKRKIPYNKILVRVAIIAAGSALTAVSVIMHVRSLLVLSVPAVIAAAISLVRIYGDIMKRINFIFNAVQNDDYAFRFAENPNLTDHALINYSLNRIKEVLDNAKLQIREKEKYFELITECADIGIITVMRNGTVLQANSKAAHLFGLMRLTHIEQLRPASAALVDTLRTIRRGEQRLVQYVDETGDMNLSLSCSDMQMGEKELRVITIGDINNELSEKEIESWNKLTRILTHEIMNSLAPVTSISNTLLSSSVDGSELRNGLQTIHSTGERLLSFVDSFRQVTRIPSPRKTPLYVADPVNEAAALTDMRGIEFTQEIEPHDIMIYADRTLITQVMVNLLKNAREAVAESDGEKRIAVHAALDPDERVNIEVSNNCGPIPPDVAENIFTPFFTTKNGGSGIGLAVSRQIVRLHGGSLRLTSNRPDCVAFTVTLD